MFGLRGNSKRRPLLLGVGALALSFIPASSLLAEVTKSGVVESLLSWADFKQSKDLKKTDGTKKNKITGVPKLDDANDAGVVQSHKCTLILTEGDSAKALVMAGLSVVGRNYYGVFPLRVGVHSKQPQQELKQNVAIFKFLQSLTYHGFISARVFTSNGYSAFTIKHQVSI